MDVKAFARHVIDIKLPIAEEYATVLRLFVAGVANLWGMTLDEIEDLKLTVSEAFLDIVDRSANSSGHISIRWRVDAERAVITLTDPSRSLRKIAQSPVLSLVAAKTDGVEIINVAGEQRIELGFKLDRKFEELSDYEK